MKCVATLRDWFIRQADISPLKGIFSITLAPGCVYSLTTTSGQAKGVTSPPPSAPLPLPYREDFQQSDSGATPRLFSDQQGTFEIAPAGGGRPGNCLRQVVTQQPVLWAANGDPSTFWHTQFAPDKAALPQSITLNLGKVRTVSALGYLPQQNGELNGSITQYVVHVSVDGEHFSQSRPAIGPMMPAKSMKVCPRSRRVISA